MVWESENEGKAGDGTRTKGKHSDSVSFILKSLFFHVQINDIEDLNGILSKFEDF